MSKTPIALSWSRISVYRQCPRQFEAKYITKEYPEDSDNPAFEKGTRIHKQLENYILFKKGIMEKEPVLGIEAINAKRIIDSFFTRVPKGNINAEKQLAVDMKWDACTWFAKPDVVKFRGIIDMLVFQGEKTVFIIDFKSGKVRPYDEDFGQLHLSASIIFELFPDVAVIKNSYLFVEHKETISITFRRENHAAMKAHFDLEYLQINEDKEFEPTKNKYCFFCDLSHNKGGNCEF